MRSRSAVLILVAISLIAGLWLYGRALDNSFRMDDFESLAAAERAREFGAAQHPPAREHFFRPGAFALFRIEYRLFGLFAGAYLAFNLLLHLAISSLGFCLLRRLGLSAAAAGLGAALFFAGFGHYGKQVLGASGGGGLATVALTLAALLAYCGPGQGCVVGKGQARRGGRGHYAVALFCAALAPLCHVSGLIAPILMAVHTLLFGRGERGRWPRLLLLTALVFGAWTLSHWLYPSPSTAAASLERSPLAPAFMLFKYLGLMLLPVQSSSSLPGLGSGLIRLVALLQLLQPLLGALFLLGTLNLGLRVFGGGGDRRGLFLALWVLLALAPFTFVPQPVDWLELRHLYAAALPFCALFGMAMAALWRRRRPFHRVLAGLLAGLALIGSLGLGFMLEAKYDRESRRDSSDRRFERIRLQRGE